MAKSKAAKAKAKGAKVVKDTSKPRVAALASGVIVRAKRTRPPRLARRNSDDQCERFCKRKLHHISLDRLSMLRNKTGESIYQVIKKEMKSKKVTHGRLATNFTKRLYNEFRLHLEDPVWDSLPESDFGDVNEDLIACIMKAHSDSPCMRDINPMIDLLSGCGELDCHNIFVCASASQPSWAMPRCCESQKVANGRPLLHGTCQVARETPRAVGHRGR